MVHFRHFTTIFVRRVRIYSILHGSGNSNSVNSNSVKNKKKCGPKRLLSPEEELFCVLYVRLRLGLLERDIAHRFNISQSHVSRILVTWLDFLYRQLRSIPIWPSQEFVRATMPESFKNTVTHIPEL